MVGREWQHLEDLIYIEGSQGIHRIQNFFEQCMGSHFPIKYDGFVTCHWRWIGDDFIFATSNSYRKNRWFNSEQKLVDFIYSTGKDEPWRNEFANEMREIMLLLKRNTYPSPDRYYADVLYSPRRPPTSGVFTPNLVTYSSDAPCVNLGLAVHTGRLHHNHNVCDYSQTVECGERFQYRSNIQLLDQFLEKRRGMSDFRNLIYKYMNGMNKSNQLDQVSEEHFLSWIVNHTTSRKHQTITQHCLDYSGVMDSVFSEWKKVVMIKNRLIDHLDQQPRTLKEQTAGQSGGEGYVSRNHQVKLVPRQRWKPKNNETSIT